MRERSKTLFGAAVVACSLVAARDADAYRPFDGTDADVAEPKVFELELGPVHYYRAGDQNFLIAPALVLNLGVGGETELVVDAQQFVALGPLDSGVSRLSLEDDDVLVKHVFRKGVLQGGAGVSIAAEGGVLTPEIQGGPGTAGFGASLDVITSYEWSWATVHWNEWFEYTRDQHADLFTGVILVGPRDWIVRPVSELFYDKDFAAGQTESLLVGAIWDALPSLAFDAGVRGARAGDTNVAEVRLGLTWSVPVGEQAPRPPTTEN